MSSNKSVEAGLALLKASKEKFHSLGLNSMATQEERDQAIAAFIGEHGSESKTQEGGIVLGKRLNMDEYNQVVEYIAEIQDTSFEAARSIVKSAAQETGLLNARSSRRTSTGIRRGSLAQA
jgi:hypothetical protein